LVDPGVVDQDVDGARFACEPLDITAEGEVRADEARAPARGFNLRDQCAPAIGVAPMDDDLGAFGGQL
jgi:hypothetical protein